MTLTEFKEQMDNLPYIKQIERELAFDLFKIVKTDNEKVLRMAVNLNDANRKRLGDVYSKTKKKK